MDNLIYASATKLAQAIRAKELSSHEIVSAFLNRIEAVNPHLNAVVQLTADTALDQARAADAARARGDLWGPLHGVPMTIKDSFDTAGVISTGGTRGRASFVPAHDATAVARLRAAGAILLGKTNTPELTLWSHTSNLVYGRTNNPHDLSRTPGGSSGGSAAIVAAGGSPLDLGTDTFGSIRIPGHFCGIAGLKPTAGRVPRTGHIIPFEMGTFEKITQVGPLARFIEDLILTLPIIAGEDGRDSAIVPVPLRDPHAVELKGLRLALYVDNGVVTPSLETMDAVRSAAQSLAAAGVVVQESRPPKAERAGALGFGLFQADGGAAVRALLERAGTTEMSPEIAWTQSDNVMSLVQFNELLAEWDLFRKEMALYIQEYDVIVCPVSATPAVVHSATADFSYTPAYNLTGWPCVVVRCGTSPEGLPINVQVVARPWREDVALAVALYLERELGGWQTPTVRL